MKCMKRIFTGALSLVLGVGSIYIAAGFYRCGSDLAPIMGALQGQDYAVILTLGAIGIAFLVIAYVRLFRSPRVYSRPVDMK
jgi:hypothetical protein